ncbi:FKBP-type peptidyl-prolyl cis-trans isomerase [Sorangium sp. So ce119]|uniref:FKBP-type peptidyl-prolyl cis-trans isomerase n=1 Tax=Sorangium sp. So ce119 TaxID=3133279 RepID=UPI003F5EDE4F
MKPLRNVLLALSCAVVLGPVAGCEDKVPEPDLPPGSAIPAVKPAEPEPADMIKEDLVVGTGPEAKDGDRVRVHYTGRLLKNNAEFDSSVGREPFEFRLGNTEVIKGWDEGVVGMKVGGKRKLTIPSRLAYGESGSPPKIPGKATLVFDIELLGVGDAPNDAAAAADKGGKAATDKAAKPAADKAAKPEAAKADKPAAAPAEKKEAPAEAK